MVAMKKVLYLALAVVATAFATSCVKELADGNQENTGNKPEIEITGQVFEAKMEATKSVIDGKTPTWVEGDAISVFGSNETAGIECTFAGEGKFQVNGDKVVEGPFYAIYPHKEGHSVDQNTGIFTATVPAEQLIKAGENTAAGALVAVAASETPEFYFRNAVGLVRLENKREDIVSIKIESTNAEQMLAGSFTMDLNPDKDAENEAPAVTPATEGGSASVTLKSAEENGVLASGVYYAAILPGKIAGIKVTFTRKNGEKTETATVTKQQAATIERNGGANLGAFFSYEIKNAQELLAWNKAAAKWTAWDVVTLTDNIDCADVITSENWEPHGFTGTFDGNGKTIDNFVIEKEGPAAFFLQMTGNAFARNLTFGENCSFSSKGTYNSARVYAASLVCEIRGNAGMDNITNYAAITGNHAGVANKGNYIAGICASLGGAKATVSNCKNYGSVTFSATPVVWTCIGGVLGESPKEETTVTNCENYGTILFNGPSNGGASINLAGIAGGSNKAAFDGCSNFGKIQYNAQTAAGGGINIGGIVGHNNSAAIPSLTNCTNGSATDNTLGEIVVSGATSGEIRMGGCVGYIQSVPTNITGFKNYGKLTNNVATSSNILMGGVAGYILGATDNTVTNCQNSGAITNSKGGKAVNLGGLVGLVSTSNTQFTNVSNTAAITNNGAFTASVNVGGIIGLAYKGTGDIVATASNSGAIKNNSGKIENLPVGIGGIIGAIENGNTSIGNDIAKAVTNTGAITNAGQNSDSGLGGIIGRIVSDGKTNTIKNCYNTAAVTRSGWNSNKKTYGHGYGGILGYAYSTAASTINIISCENKGNILKSGGTVDNVHLGGIAGSFYQTTTTGLISGCTNSGTVMNDSGTNTGNGKYSYTGGIIGYFGGKGEIKDCVNNNTITNKVSTGSTNEFIRIGGIVGDFCGTKITNCTNNAAVKDESTSPGGFVGGIAGNVKASATLSNCDNKGAVSCLFNSEKRSTLLKRTDIHMGGIIGQVPSGYTVTLTGCDNSGSVTNLCAANANGKTKIGGLIGLCYDNTLTDCSNTGDIINSANDTKEPYVAGFIGQVESEKTTKITNCSYNANIVPQVTSYTICGILVGRLTDKIINGDLTCTTTISGVTVKGKFANIELTADNYGTYTFGTNSDYGKKSGHATTGITYAE